MGENYRPSIKQAALRFDISEELLQLLVELHGVEPMLEDKECPLYRLEDLQNLVRKYRTNRDIAMIRMFRKVEELDSDMKRLVTEIKGIKALPVPKRRFSLTRFWPPTRIWSQHR